MAVAYVIVVGHFFPDFGKSLKPLGDGFIKLVKMMIAPGIFCTLVHGIASMGDLKKLSPLGFKALLYFEIGSTLALVIGNGVATGVISRWQKKFWSTPLKPIATQRKKKTIVNIAAR